MMRTILATLASTVAAQDSSLAVRPLEVAVNVSTSCSDTPPDKTHTCAQQKSWGKCTSTWMKGYCCSTCFGCKGCSGTGPSPAPAVDTMFLSDIHIGDNQYDTWELLDKTFADFRKSHPKSQYFVHTGDNIKHQSPTEDARADVYVNKLMEIAEKHGFTTSNMFIAQGNNDGPHDKPLSAKWASAVAKSGIVPHASLSTCQEGSYYKKCILSPKNTTFCALVINTDLEVYGSGDEAAEDKAKFNATLSAGHYEFLMQSKQGQRDWVKAQIKELGTTSFFMIGHHPQLKNFFPKDNKAFKGGICGHTHVFEATSKHSSMLTVDPGWLGAPGKGGTYLAGALEEHHIISLTKDNVVARPFHTVSGTMDTLVV